MEAFLSTSCRVRPCVAIAILLGTVAAVGRPKPAATLSDDDLTSVGHINDRGIYVASRKESVVKSKEEAGDKEASFFKRELDQDAEEAHDTVDSPEVVRDDGDVQPAALAEAEAFSMSNLDESFIFWDRRRRRRRYDCRWLQWQAWKSCTVPCGAGQKQRDRKTDGPHWSGKVCTGPKSEFETCNLQGCKVDCNWAHWGAWGPCSKTCGFGLQVRQRGVLPYTDVDGGKDCDDADRKASQQCNRFHCPVPCTFAAWDLWGGCSMTCGAGLKRRTRAVVGPFHGGAPCLDALYLEEKCNNFVCPIDCGWTQWGGWGVCSRTCGGGIKLRERVYDNQMENGGLHCPGSPAEVLACSVEECPIDCKWAPWAAPGPCTKTCGGGSAHRHRAKVTLQAFGGAACIGPNTEVKPCNVEPCAIDCVYSMWEPWGECTATCGGGIHTATRNGTDPFHGGLECMEQNKTKEGECNTQPCAALSVEGRSTQSHPVYLAVLVAALGLHRLLA